MKIKLYHDGIAFYTDKEEEIAFYSPITDRVTYSDPQYKYHHPDDCIWIDYKDNIKIMEEIKRYKRSLEAGI